MIHIVNRDYDKLSTFMKIIAINVKVISFFVWEEKKREREKHNPILQKYVLSQIFPFVDYNSVSCIRKKLMKIYKQHRYNRKCHSATLLDDHSYSLASNLPPVTFLLNKFRSSILLQAFIPRFNSPEQYLFFPFLHVVYADFAVHRALYIECILFSLHPLRMIFACTTVQLFTFTSSTKINRSYAKYMSSLFD